MRTICLVGAFDTKAAEYGFVREQILARGHQVLTVNKGIMGSPNLFPVDVQRVKGDVKGDVGSKTT